VLALCDALVLAGGGDVEPRHYAQEPHPMLYGHDPARDAQELALVPAALRVKIPLLAICRGLQVLNVALGGDLIQHLPDVVGESVIHRGNEERRFLPHLARVSPQSQLAEVLGTSTVSVASAHHQAVGRAGRGVIPVAWADDGMIEAIEIEGEAQVLAVQWHPEESEALDASQARLFQWLIQRGRVFRAGHSLR
jgi:putative glutamine amidotransferase